MLDWGSHLLVNPSQAASDHLHRENIHHMVNNEASRDGDSDSDEVHSTSCASYVDDELHNDSVSSPVATPGSSFNSSGTPDMDSGGDADESIVSPASEIDDGSCTGTPTPQKSTTPKMRRFNLDLDAAISDIYSNSTTTTSTMPLGDVVTAAQSCIVRHSRADGTSTKTFEDIWEIICDAADERNVTVSEAAAFVSLLQLTETVNRSAKGCISISNDPSRDNELLINYT